MTSTNRRPSFAFNLSSARALLFLSAVTLSTATLLLSGCGSFFSCEGKTQCPSTGTTGGGGTTGVNYLYVSDSITANTDINGYAPSSTAVTATPSSPYNLDFIPSAIAITPSNSFIYISSESSTGSVYGYSIGTGGQPSILNTGTPILNDDVASMDISPDGQWLFALDALIQQVEIYSINTTNGALTFSSAVPLVGAPNGDLTPISVKVAPSGAFVVCSLGTGGANVFAFDTTTGVPNLAGVTGIIPATAATGIYAATWDANNFLYTAGTAGLQVFTVNATGGPTLVKTYATGTAPRSVLVNSTSTAIYVGNQTDGTITGYTIGANAALTAITGSPFAAPPTVSALATDSTGGYLIAAGYDGSKGIQLYTISTTGVLTPVASAGTGTGTTAPAIVMAATH
jgi:6-phosphogluconolactonase